MRARRWRREGIGLLLLTAACRPSDTIVEAELDEVFVLTVAAPSVTFETTYCLEELVWQTVAVSATFSLMVDAPAGLTATIGRLDGDVDTTDETGETGETGESQPQTDGTGAVFGDGLATVSLQGLEDWSGVGRRCAIAVVRVSSDELAGGEEIRLEQPRVRMSGLSPTTGCEESLTNADSFSVELLQVQVSEN